MTARTLIRDAMQEIGALATGEALATADADAGLTRLNAMLKLWQTERLTIFQVTRSAFGVTANQASYTIGPSASAPDWTLAVRPQWIDHAAILMGTGESSYEMPLEMLSDPEWQRLGFPLLTSTLPTKCSYTPGVPTGTFELWPIPSIDPGDVVLYVPTPMDAASSLDTNYTFAPGYEEAVRYNLAVRLAPLFGRVLDPMIDRLAVSAKAQIKRANEVAHTLGVDAALLGGGGVFDWRTGEIR
jgi:hypothetical protein